MSSPLKARGITGRKPGLRGQAYARKEKELTNAINRAEKKQLDEFLRARTEVVDRDIRDLRSRLHVDSPQRQPPELPVYGELVHSRAQSGHDPGDLHVAGVGTPSRSTHTNGMRGAATTGAESSRTTPKDARQTDFLQRLNNAVYDSGLTDEQVSELLHPGPSDANPTVSMRHLIEVLQLDLVLPVTREDQAVIALCYGASDPHGMPRAASVDAIGLFRDAGINLAPYVSGPATRDDNDRFAVPPGSKTAPTVRLSESRHPRASATSSSPYVLKPNAQNAEDDDSDLDTDLERQARRSMRGPIQPDGISKTVAETRSGKLPWSDRREDNYIQIRRRSESTSNDGLKLQASKNVDMLKGMHDLVREAEETALKEYNVPYVDEPDEGLLDTIIAKYKHLETASVPTTTDDAKQLSRTPPGEEKAITATHSSRNDSSLRPAPSDERSFRTSKGSSLPRSRAAADRNETDQAISELDRDMEDMGENLNGMLDSIGRNPEPSNKHPADDEEAPNNSLSHSRQILAQNAKVGLHAMSRAGLLDGNERLPRRPPHSATLTSRGLSPSRLERPEYGYTGQRPHGDIGGNSQSRQISPVSAYSLKVPRENAAQPYYVSSAEGATSSDGSFSDLCERRLVFEIMNHRHPVETFRSLLHTVMDTARSNGRGNRLDGQAPALIDADPACVPPAPNDVHNGFITATQLLHISRQLGLTLSLAEIELIAAGFASDGCGGFNAAEFCEAMQDLLYATDSMFVLQDTEGGHASRERMDRSSIEDYEHRRRKHGYSNSMGNWDPNASKGIGFSNHREGGVDSSLAVHSLGSDISAELNDYWMIVEFEFVDELLSQLEAMSPSDRRRRLLSLRHLLWAAEANSELLRPSKARSRHGYMSDGFMLDDTDQSSKDVEREVLDGFTLLKCLVNAGFDISRYKRSRFLSAVEELGGRIRYAELCNILMSGCADWPSAEIGLTSKILKSMGPTVPQRRVWLARLRDDLNGIVATQRDRNPSSQGFDRSSGNMRNNSSRSLPNRGGISEGEDDVHNPGIPASSFLHVLRELGTGLSVDEEATLLDCLDIERQSELVAAEATFTGGKPQRSYKTHRRESDIDGDDARGSEEGSLKVPLVFYKSFLAFCNRHSGDWTMFLPNLYNKLKKNITSRIDGAFNDVLELKSLFLSFDETSSGIISRRSFLVAAHRSNLFSKLSEEEVTQLTEILSADSGGSIDYRLFLYYLQSLALVGSGEGTAREKAGMCVSPGGYRILSQLLSGGSAGDGTLTPLRSWLSRALRDTVDEGQSPSLQLGRETIAQMLRDFGVVYEEEDLIQFLQELSLTSSALNIDEVRGDWGDRQPGLCDKIRRCFAAAPKGAARRLLTRLNSFSSSSAVPLARFSFFHRKAATSKDMELSGAATVAVMDSSDMRSKVVRREVFQHVVQACGMPLDEDDIYILADATDLTPFAEYISPNEALLSALKESGMQNKVPSGFRASLTIKQEQEDDGKAFAVRHFKSQLSKAALQQKRTPLQWQADVFSVFTGFDRGGGFVTGTDFKTALNILGVSMSYDLLASLVSRNSLAFSAADLINYEEVLSNVFENSTDAAAVEGRTSDDTPSSDTHRSHSSPRESNRHASAIAHLGYGSNSSHSAVEKTARHSEKIGSNAVKALISVVRRGMERFIVNGSDIEDVCVDLVNVFNKFDTNKDGGDDVVLDKEEWEDVIDYFAVPRADEESSPQRRRARSGPAMVNYVEFIETVLDSSQLREIKSRLLSHREEGNGASASRIKIIKSSLRPSSRGATVSFNTPELFSGETMPARSRTRSAGLQPSKLTKTTTGRYHSKSTNSSMYSPVVGGSDRKSAWGILSPKGRATEGNSSLQAAQDKNNKFVGRGSEEVKLTQKQFAKAKQLKFRNQELRALEDLKLMVSEALNRRPLPRGKSKADVLREWLEMEDTNRSASLSKNSVIATLNALGLPYESWSTPSQRNLIDFLAARGGGTVKIDDFMALIGAKL